MSAVQTPLVEFTLLGNPHDDVPPTKGAVRSGTVIMVVPGLAQCVKKTEKDAAVVPITGQTQIDVPVVYITLINGMHIVVTETYAQVMKALCTAEQVEPKHAPMGVCMNCNQLDSHAPGCMFAS